MRIHHLQEAAQRHGDPAVGRKNRNVFLLSWNVPLTGKDREQ